jgi:hypothetical protein
MHSRIRAYIFIVVLITISLLFYSTNEIKSGIHENSVQTCDLFRAKRQPFNFQNEYGSPSEDLGVKGSVNWVFILKSNGDLKLINSEHIAGSVVNVINDGYFLKGYGFFSNLFESTFPKQAPEDVVVVKFPREGRYDTENASMVLIYKYKNPWFELQPMTCNFSTRSSAQLVFAKNMQH